MAKTKFISSSLFLLLTMLRSQDPTFFLSPHLQFSFSMTPFIASRILQVLDHVGIYLLIAGTYTPFLLIGLHHHAQVCDSFVKVINFCIFHCNFALSESTNFALRFSELLLLGRTGKGLVSWPVDCRTLRKHLRNLF